MKNLILMFAMVACIGCTQHVTAQKQNEKEITALCYMSQLYAFAQIDGETRNYKWSDWEDCKIGVFMDSELTNITVMSAEPQMYRIIDKEDWKDDEGGGRSRRMVARDQYGDQCMCRLRYDPKGKFQLYIDFSNVAWCYSGLVSIVEPIKI